jgi:hypothetical protein
MSLFPILADPNPPSNLAGLDVSLAAGQMTALDGADSFTMTASTLTANSASASWADIVDAVVNPPADQALQSVLNAGNSASTADSGVASISLTDGVDNASLGASSIQMSATSGAYTSNHTGFGINAVDTTGATLEASLTASSLSMLSGTDTTSLSVGSLSMVDAAASTTLTDGSLVLMDIPSTSIATLTYASVAVGKDDDYVEMTKDNLVLANATVSTTITPVSIGGGDATLNYSLAAPTDANGQNALLTSSKSVRMTCEQNFAFSCGDDVVVFPRSNVITTTAGGSTDQYLSLQVNGVAYRISLLAQPIYPLRTISTISIGGGQNIFVQEPYFQWDYYTVSFTITGFTGAAESSNFEILSYPTDAFQPDVSYSVKKVFINANGSYSFSVQNLTPERYNAVQFFQTSANSFNVTSFIINGTQQIAAPNPVPLVCPPV